jgi:murein DD-endopeptidase MepM/ murein hydrolase activator NlpD
MTGRRRLRAALVTLSTFLVGLGLWAIPVASGETLTAGTTTTATVAYMCVQADLVGGSAEIFKVPVGSVPPTGAALVEDHPIPTPSNPSAIVKIVSSPTCTVTTTSTTSTTTTTTTTTTSPTSTSTTTPGSTTTTTTTTTPTTTTTTPTNTTTTPTTKTGPSGPPHKQRSTSSNPPHHSSGRNRHHHTSSHKPTHTRHHRSRTKTVKAKQPNYGKQPKGHHRKHASNGANGASSGATTTAPSVSLPSAPPSGVPNFFIDSFQIPPFLLPIYQAAGIQYQVPWQVLAAINEIETDYGRNLSVSSAGAVGWMQFMPATWKEWGIDANGDGVADPYNPVDAIFSAARYLQAAGASTDLSKAIFAYNHAGWYVQSVLLRAKLIGGLPQQLVSALTGLVEGHFPVAAKASYSDDAVVSAAGHRVTGSNAAITVDSSPATKGTTISAKQGSPVIAVNDGKIIKMGQSRALGRYIELQDATGNVYTYSQLGSISAKYPVPKTVSITRRNAAKELGPVKVPDPKSAASAGTQPKLSAMKGMQARLALTAASRRSLADDPQPSSPAASPASTKASSTPAGAASAGAQANAAGGAETSSQTTAETSTTSAPLVKERLFAHPGRPASYAAGGMQQLHSAGTISSFKNYFADTLHLPKNQYTLQPLRVGSIVIAGTILGRIGAPRASDPSHMYFQIQPAGHDAPDIDPKPILDGWRLLQATNVYRANGVNPFYGGLGESKSKDPSVGQVLLMSKQQLEQRVLRDPHVEIYACGRRDIEAGRIDRRVLAAIEYLSASGLDPDVTGLACDASVNGTSGVDEAGTTGQSVDISKINGVPIEGHTGPGSITDQAIRRLLALQGSMAPTQIVGPISYRDQSTTLALPNHQDRIQVLFGTSYGANGNTSKQVKSILKPGQWTTLINRLSQLPEPVVPVRASRYAIRQPAH